MAKAGDLILEAARKQAEGEIAVPRQTLKYTRYETAGIGEHADITEAVISELDKMVLFQDLIDMLDLILVTIKLY